MLNIGYRAHDFGFFDTLDNFIEAVHKFVPEANLHFAPHKTIRNLKPWTSWNDEYAATIREKLEKNNILIEVLGCTINPVASDEEFRHREVERYKKNLRLAHSFGASIVGTETGSWSDDLSFSLDTAEPHVYETLLFSIDQMLNEAIKCNTVIGIEPAAHSHTICSVERLRNLLDQFNDNHLMITMDPINLISLCGIPEKDGSFRRVPSEDAQRAYYYPLIHEFADRIAVLHSKDFVLMENGLKKGNLTALTGVFDWKGFIHELKMSDLDFPIILENMNPVTLTETVHKLNSYYI